MSLQPVELFAQNPRAASLRVWPRHIRPKNFAAGSGTLPLLTPVARNDSTLFMQAWTAPVSEIDTITKTGTVTSGTWTITIDGQTSAAIAYNASNAVIQAAIEAMPNVKPGDVILSGGGANGVQTGVLTLTFAQSFTGQAITVTTGSGSLVGGGSYVLAQSTAGVTLGNGLAKIDSFVWPDPVTLNAGGEVEGNCLTAGIVHHDDIPLVGGVLQGALDAALQDKDLRKLGFVIQGLQGA